MDKIIVLDTLRIERNKPRKCTCGDRRQYSVDKVNREVACGCGIVWDAFEALLDVAVHYEDENRSHRLMNEQRQEWVKEKPHSVLFKRLERSYRRGEMLPSCPRCDQTFDFKDVNFFTNAQFYKALEAKAAQKGKGEA